jgi:Tol biopolymer transport system component
LEADLAMMRLSLGLLITLTVGCLCAVLLTVSISQLLPQEDEIVYSANLDNTDSEIYRMALGRQLSVILTRNTTEDNQPAWSSDGQQIAFVSNHQGQYTIFVMDAQGRGVHPLTDSPQNNFSPTWSPDNRSIAYVTARQEFARQITEVLLTDLQSGITRRVTIPYPNAISPTWAPDSRHLAFTSGGNGSANRIIYDLDLQTGDTSPLIANHDIQLNPTWSPDGGYLLYLAYDSDPGVYLWDSQQSKSVLLFKPNPLNLRNPSWSQDSRYIIYAPQTTLEINSILRLDVTACLSEHKDCTPQPLTHVAGIYDNPRWRPRSS